MENNFEKYKDYVIFASVKNELDVKYLKYEDKYIKLFFNDNSDFINETYGSEFICDTIEDISDVIGNMTIIFDVNLYDSRYDISEYKEGQIVSKNHPMYIENVKNTFFETDNEIINIYHYPNECVSIMNKSYRDFTAFVGNKNDAKIQLTYGLKKILGVYNYEKNKYSLHASAVKKNGKAFVFLSNSYSGKTTIFLNLIANGYEPLNDDIIFWTLKDNKIYVSGCPILFNKRDESENVIMTDNYIDLLHQRSKNLYYTKCFENIPVSKIFIPKYGFEISSVEELLSVDKKKILRSCSAHTFVNPDNQFLEAFNALLRCSFFSLNMSNDYNDVLKCFDATENIVLEK